MESKSMYFIIVCFPFIDFVKDKNAVLPDPRKSQVNSTSLAFEDH